LYRQEHADADIFAVRLSVGSIWEEMLSFARLLVFHLTGKEDQEPLVFTLGIALPSFSRIDLGIY